MRTYDFGHWKSPFVIEWHKDAGGSRTHFDRVAAGCRAVWLQRLNSLAAYRETETPSQAEAVGLEPTKRYFRGAKGNILVLPCLSSGRRIRTSVAWFKARRPTPSRSPSTFLLRKTSFVILSAAKNLPSSAIGQGSSLRSE